MSDTGLGVIPFPLMAEFRTWKGQNLREISCGRAAAGCGVESWPCYCYRTRQQRSRNESMCGPWSQGLGEFISAVLRNSPNLDQEAGEGEGWDDTPQLEMNKECFPQAGRMETP